MLVAAFPAGPLAANCYLVSRAEGAECVIVDTGMDAAEGIDAVVREHDLTPVAVLLTHGHFDHVWSAAPVAASYDIPVWIHPADRHLLSDPMSAISGESARMLRAQLERTALMDTEPADVRDATGGSTVDLAGLTFTVDHAPGHTPGTVAYRVDHDGPEPTSQLMFTGDFLFAGSIGRTDLVGGDNAAMTRSLTSRVLPLADDVAVLPGHGPRTTVGRERATNPFLLPLAEQAAAAGRLDG